MKNPFFKNVGPYPIDKLLKKVGVKNSRDYKKDKIFNISDLSSSTRKDLTFFHSKKYHLQASKTKASYCITLQNLAHHLPKDCKPICVDNCLLYTSPSPRDRLLSRMPSSA